MPICREVLHVRTYLIVEESNGLLEQLVVVVAKLQFQSLVVATRSIQIFSLLAENGCRQFGKHART